MPGKKIVKSKINKPAKTSQATRDEKGRFQKGNKIAEKWTEKTVTELLTRIWGILVKGHEDVEGNYVRANDIKTLQEVCIMCDLDPDTWAYIKDKFKECTPVLRFIKKILWLLEARLVYSGETMDIFVLKNHYDYTDKRDVTTKGKEVGGSFLDFLMSTSNESTGEGA